MPAVWLNSIRSVIAFSGAEPSASFICPSSGSHFEAGSSSESFPSSTRIMIVLAFTDFVIEAIQNNASFGIGSFFLNDLEVRVTGLFTALLGLFYLGFALFFHNYSTFLGRPGIYLEDLFVKPEHRGQGVGRALLRFLARLAQERNCGRLEWSVLDWNESAIGFYKSLGAIPLEEWTIFRLKDEALSRLAGH